MMLHKWKILTAIAAMMLQSQLVYAQSNNVEKRVEKLEKEVRAVQRKVFPQNSNEFFQPEITSQSSPPISQARQNNENAAISDLLVRVNSLEEQLAALTGQIEEQQFKMRSVEKKLAELDSGLKAQQKTSAQPIEKTPQAATPAANNNASSSARRNAVAAIEIPDTGDAFEDSYNYGFRLWEKKFYPEAQVQLQNTIDKFPKHPRVSFARNLLGRSWLDNNKPSTAAKIFYDNYKDDPRGGRAPESLYFLGSALYNMKEPAKACEAYGELAGAYPDVAEGRLANRLAKGLESAKCS